MNETLGQAMRRWLSIARKNAHQKKLKDAEQKKLPASKKKDYSKFLKY